MSIQCRKILSGHGFGLHLRRAFLSLSLLLVPALSTAALVCETGVSSVPILDPLGASGELGELTLDCGGGVATDPLPTVNFQAFFNVVLLQDVDPILSDGVSDYSGLVLGANAVLFTGIPFDPVESHFTLHEVFVNPSLQNAGFAYIAFLSVAGAVSVPISNPLQTVALNGSLPGNAPEPSTGLLLFVALAPLVAFRRRRAQASLRCRRAFPKGQVSCIDQNLIQT
jgi:hypothetical protein